VGEDAVTTEPVVPEAQWSLRHIVLDADPNSARQARRFVADVAGDDSDATATAMLLTSELVTNAVLHAQGPITVQAGWSDGMLRVEVVDTSPSVPRLRHRSKDAMTGRGLMLVETLAVAWGAERRDRGKAVWFLLDGAPIDEAAAGDGELQDLHHAG
jgi:anti-sigma regulatory factor (Ser/Thr protein kinase)